MKPIFALAFSLLALPVFAADAPVTHRVLGQDKGHVAILDAAGHVEWEMPCGGTAHDIALLPNGNLLFPTNDTTIVEMTPDKKIVWTHVSKPKDGYTGGVQIHAFQRLKDGRTMVAESGNQRIIEVDKDDKIVKEIPLTVDHPSEHRDTRLARKLDNGHYLVCHEGDGKIREYDENGKVIWTYVMDLNNQPATDGHDGHGINVFDAVRLKNGNTLIGGGNNNRVFEVDKSGKIVWSIEQNELPGIKLFWVTTIEKLPNGDIVIGNTHAGPNNPQLIEVTPDKKVVWTMQNMDAFGNDLAAAQVLDVKGKVIR